LTLNTTGGGTQELATAITGLTLATSGDYTASTVTFGSGATSGATTAITVTATDDRLVEGPETFTSTLTGATSNATVSQTGSGSVQVTDNDTATVTLSDTASVTEGGATSTQTV